MLYRNRPRWKRLQALWCIAILLVWNVYSVGGILTPGDGDSKTKSSAKQHEEDGKLEDLPKSYVEIESNVKIDDGNTLAEKRGLDVADVAVEMELDDRSGSYSGTIIGEVQDSDGGQRQNYASREAGATILDYSQGAKGSVNLLVPDSDQYMLTPCEIDKKWVVISLSEDIHADAIAIANYEKFSSLMKNFLVLGSVTYPTDTWLILGNFTAEQKRGEQRFEFEGQHHVRYLKIRMNTHYGNEYYCTLSQIKAFGSTFTQVISQLEKSINDENDLIDTLLPKYVQDDAVAQTVNVTPVDITVKLPDIVANFTSNFANASETSLAEVCLRENTTLNLDQFQFPSCPALNVTIYPTNSSSSQSTSTKTLAKHANTSVKDGNTTPSSQNESVLNGSDPAKPNSTVTKQIGENATQQHVNATSDVPVVNIVLPSSHSDTEPHSEEILQSVVLPPNPNGKNTNIHSLGRFENIFIRITKKIQALEVNQSMFDRYLNDIATLYKSSFHDLQQKHLLANDQLNGMVIMVKELKNQIDNDMANKDAAYNKYMVLLEEARKENLLLKDEILLVREVITTMKVGILFAIILSGVIITFFILRTLYRCLLGCKRRAGLREWLHKMNETGIYDTSENWVNRSLRFGSSWDDSAIKRTTLYRGIVGENGFRRHHMLLYRNKSFRKVV